MASQCILFLLPKAVVPVFNGEANNFKMGLFTDIHEGSGGC